FQSCLLKGVPSREYRVRPLLRTEGNGMPWRLVVQKGWYRDLSSLWARDFFISRKGVSGMLSRLNALREEAQRAIAAADRSDQLKELRVKYLGKKGAITSILRGMKDVPPADRPKVGSLANEIRGELERLIAEKEEELAERALEERLKKEALDVTLPGDPRPMGSIHPLSALIEEIEDIFIGMGFEVAEGPEVEWDE